MLQQGNMHPCLTQLIRFNLAIAVTCLVAIILPPSSAPSKFSRHAYQAFIQQSKPNAQLEWHQHTLNQITYSQSATTSTPRLLSIRFSPESEGIFQAYPPTPIDYAIVLDQLIARNLPKIAITAPLSWQNTNQDATPNQASLDSLPLASLAHEISRFDSTLIACSTTLAPLSKPPPAAFTRTQFNPEQIHGKRTLLPQINHLNIQPNFKLPANSALASHHILSSDNQIPTSTADGFEAIKIPLVVRWDQQLFPTFNLAAIALALDVPLDSCTLHLGKRIQLTPSHAIPIDQFGYTSIPLQALQQADPRPPSVIDATDLLDPTFPLSHQEPESTSPPSLVFLEMAGPTQSPRSSQPAPSSQIVNYLLQKSRLIESPLLRPSSNLTTWAAVLILALLASFASSQARLFLIWLSLLIISLIGLPLLLAESLHYWLPLHLLLSATFTPVILRSVSLLYSRNKLLTPPNQPQEMIKNSPNHLTDKVSPEPVSPQISPELVELENKSRKKSSIE